MKKNQLLLLFFICNVTVNLIGQYLYPVAYTNNTDLKVYVLYQKTPEFLELWVWSPENSQAVLGLTPTFSCAGLQILPQNEGFSFIDNGRIRIKYFDQTTPLSIPLDMPLYEMTLVHWIDSYTCYFSAKKREKFGIFQATLDGTCTVLMTLPSSDCMYPQKIADQLFYIERIADFSGEMQYAVKICNYSRPEISNVVVNFNNTPIAFLTMISLNEGFVISHPKAVSAYEKGLEFTCHHIQYSDGIWAREPLFTFIIPTQLLFTDSDEYLHESMLPLLPRYYNDQVYFCSSPEPLLPGSRRRINNLEVYSYTLSARNITQLTQSAYRLFTPIKIDSILYCGGELSDQNMCNLPSMRIGIQGQMILTLPSLHT